MSNKTVYRIDDQLFIADAEQPARFTCRKCQGRFTLFEMQFWTEERSAPCDRATTGVHPLTVLGVGNICERCLAEADGFELVQMFLREAVAVAVVLREGSEETGRLHQYWGPFSSLQKLEEGRYFNLEGERCGTVFLDLDDCLAESDIPSYAYKAAGSDTWHTYEQWLAERRSNSSTQ